MNLALEEIGNLVEKVPTWNPRQKPNAHPFKYVDLSSIDKEAKVIDDSLVPTVTPSEAPSRARQLISLNDVLVSSVRPNLNGVALVNNDIYSKATASTGYCVLRPKKDKLNSEYLYYWVQTDTFINDMVKRSTGANYPAVSDKTVKSHKIPCPPIEEQRRIATILSKADALRRGKAKAISLIDNLLRSVFLDMFGDPIANTKKWKVENLNNLSIKICSGSTPVGGNKVYVEDGIVFLRSQNVWRKKIELDDVVYIDKATHKRMNKTSLKNGDLLITKTGRINTENSSLGRASIFLGKDDSANINGHVYLIRLKPEVVNEFILYIITTNEYRDYIRSVCVGGIDKRQINKDHLEQFPIIYPPIEAQQKFIDILQTIEKQKLVLSQQLNLANNMFSSLSQRAFCGELTMKKAA